MRSWDGPVVVVVIVVAVVHMQLCVDIHQKTRLVRAAVAEVTSATRPRRSTQEQNKQDERGVIPLIKVHTDAVLVLEKTSSTASAYLSLSVGVLFTAFVHCTVMEAASTAAYGHAQDNSAQMFTDIL